MADQQVTINLDVKTTGAAQVSELKSQLQGLGSTATEVGSIISTKLADAPGNVSKNLNTLSNSIDLSARKLNLFQEAMSKAGGVGGNLLDPSISSKVAQEIKSMSNAYGMMMDKAATASTKAFMGNFEGVAKQAAQATSGFDKLGNRYMELARQVEGYNKSFLGPDTTIKQLASTMGELSSKTALVANEANKIAPAVDKGNHALDEKNSRLDGAFFRVAKLVIAYQAIYGIINMIGKGFDLWKGTLEKGIQTVDDYRMSLYGGAALIASLTDKSVPVEQAYKLGKEYMTWLWQTARDVDQYVASGATDIVKASKEMTSWGIMPKTEDQVKKVGQIVDALKAATAGMGSSTQQLFSEIRNLFMGDSANMRGSQLLQNLVKVDREAPEKIQQLREEMKKTQDAGPVLEYITSLLRGFVAAGDDIQKTWTSLAESFKSGLDVLLISAFGEAYDQIVKYGWALLQVFYNYGELTEAGEKLAASISRMWSEVSGNITGLIDKIAADPEILIGALNTVVDAITSIGKAAVITAEAVIRLAEGIGRIQQYGILGSRPEQSVAGAMETVDWSLDAGSNKSAPAANMSRAADKVGEAGNSFSSNVIDSSNKMSSTVDSAGSSFGGQVVSAANTFAMIVAGALDAASFGLMGAVDNLKRSTELTANVLANQQMGTQFTEQGLEAQRLAGRKMARDRMTSMDMVAIQAEANAAQQRQGKLAAPNIPLSASVFDPLKTKGGGGGGSDGEPKRLLSIFDTLTKDIARLSEGKFAEVEANLTKTIDQIHGKEVQRNVTKEELIVLANKRAALQRLEVEDNYQMLVAKGEKAGFLRNEVERKKALRDYGSTEEKKLAINQLYNDKAASLALAQREKVLSFQKSYVDALASSAPDTREQLQWQRASLRLEEQIGDAKLEKALKDHEITQSLYNQLVPLKSQADLYKQMALDRKEWEVLGFYGGAKIAEQESITTAQTWAAKNTAAFLQGIPQQLSQSMAQMFVDTLKGNKINFDEMGYTIAGSMIQKMMEGWITQVMPLINSTLSEVGKWLSSAFGGGFPSISSSDSGGGGGGGGYLMSAASSLATALFKNNAIGNAFGPNGIVPFARGGVVSRPTVFPFASGIGLMGEAGPEAIMPLTRLNSGQLGVLSNGGSAGPINITVQNNTSTPVKGTTKKVGDREFILMLDEINANLINSSSKTSKALRNSGVSQPTTPR